MDPTMEGSLIGGGLGLLKGMTVDRAKEDRARALAVMALRMSPYTHLQQQAMAQAEGIPIASPLDSAMQGAGAGAAMGGNIQNQSNQNDLNKALTNYYANLAAKPVGSQ